MCCTRSSGTAKPTTQEQGLPGDCGYPTVAQSGKVQLGPVTSVDMPDKLKPQFNQARRGGGA